MLPPATLRAKYSFLSQGYAKHVSMNDVRGGGYQLCTRRLKGPRQTSDTGASTFLQYWFRGTRRGTSSVTYRTCRGLNVYILSRGTGRTEVIFKVSLCSMRITPGSYPFKA